METAKTVKNDRKFIKINIYMAMVSLLISVTFSIFGPLSLYLSNISEIWFSIGDIWWITILGGILLFVACYGLSFIFRGKSREIYLCILFGVALGLYIQGNWIFTDYGLLDGRSIDWGSYTNVAIINTMMWLVFILCPFALRYFFKNMWENIVKYISLFLILVQVIALGTLLVTTDLTKNQDTYLTTEGEFELSKNKNIVIFVLDAFDSSYFEALLKENPELKEEFKDFTYYPDTAVGAARTKVALPAILTGVPYTMPMSYKDYIDYSYTQTELYKTLKHYDYDVGIYTEPLVVSSKIIDIINNMSKGKTYIKSYGSLTKYLYQFTSFKYMPHILKSGFWFYSDLFNELKAGGNDENYNSDNVNFFQKLIDERIKIGNSVSTYRFYYLQGAHPPYNMNEYAQRVSPKNTSQLKQAKGSLYMVSEYVKNLKEQGIYDNTSIIIMADHGDVGYSQNPLFMIKRFNETKDFEISYAPISYYDLNATLLQMITNKSISKKTIFDFEEGDARTRYFYKDDSKNSSTSIVEYAINGYAGDSNSVSATGNIYLGNSSNVKGAYEYKLGTLLKFGPDGTAIPHSMNGFSITDMHEYSWTDGKSAKIRFDLSNVPNNDLIVKINTMVYDKAGDQRI